MENFLLLLHFKKYRNVTHTHTQNKNKNKNTKKKKEKKNRQFKIGLSGKVSFMSLTSLKFQKRKTTSK